MLRGHNISLHGSARATTAAEKLGQNRERLYPSYRFLTLPRLRYLVGCYDLYGQLGLNFGVQTDGCAVFANGLDGVGNFYLALIDLRRSEEHTSELQSRGHRVCRLVLE